MNIRYHRCVQHAQIWKIDEIYTLISSKYPQFTTHLCQKLLCELGQAVYLPSQVLLLCKCRDQITFLINKYSSFFIQNLIKLILIENSLNFHTNTIYRSGRMLVLWSLESWNLHIYVYSMNFNTKLLMLIEIAMPHTKAILIQLINKTTLQ